MLEHKITAAIIAGSETELKQMAAEIEGLDEISLVGVATAKQHGHSIIASYAPQLIFVDVELTDFSGLGFVEELHLKNIYPEIVFVAYDDSKAFDTLSLKPLDFLLKPIKKEDVSSMLGRLKHKLKRQELKRKMDIYARYHNVSVKRVFHQKKGVIILHLDEIVFCKASRSKTIVKLTNDESVVLKTNLTETEETINDQQFFKISRSYIINRNYLRKIDKKNSKCLLYYDGNYCEIPASRNIIKRLESLYTKPVY